MKAPFKSKYSPGPRSGFNPKSGARPEMSKRTLQGADGSVAQAESQVLQSPAPFTQGSALGNAPVSHAGFKRQQVHGSSAGGTRPRANTAAAPRSEPMAHSSRMKAVGYSPDYKAQHNPSTHAVARTRVMRGQVPGAKPLIDDSDLFSPDAIKQWNQNRRGL